MHDIAAAILANYFAYWLGFCHSRSERARSIATSKFCGYFAALDLTRQIT
jgi:hypothetical protein